MAVHTRFITVHELSESLGAWWNPTTNNTWRPAVYNYIRRDYFATFRIEEWFAVPPIRALHERTHAVICGCPFIPPPPPPPPPSPLTGSIRLCY